MMYTFRNKCEELPDIEYDDGLQFVYFNTKGQKGGSQAIKNMLTYIQNSDSKNAVDDATRKIDFYVNRVKSLPEVEAGYMTLGDYFDSMLDRAKEEMAEDVRREVTEAVRKEMAEAVTKEVTEAVTKEVTESVTKEVTASVTRKITGQSIKAIVEIFQEHHDTKENAAAGLRSKFPEYAGQAEKLVEKYWKDDL